MSKRKQKTNNKQEKKAMTTSKKLDDGLMRQGDVLLRRIGADPPKGFDTAKKREREKNGDKILAHGEVTGHAHRVKSLQADLYDMNGGAVGSGLLAMTILEVKEPEVQLTHEEHSPVNITQGYYQVIRQREYTPEAIRNVAD